MKLLRHDSDGALIELSREEFLCVNNALNEVCHGFRLADFPASIGTPRDDALGLLGKVHALGARVWPGPVRDTSLDIRRVEVDLARHDLLVIRNAVSETLRELGVEEFDTRVGVSFEEGQKVLKELDEFLRAVDQGSG